MTERYFFHSFPRPKAAENPSDTLARGLAILNFITDLGLICAPERVVWDTAEISGNSSQLEILQQRACFTELEEDELSRHCKTFGPISLAFKIPTLRALGALPVIYAPQGAIQNPLSYMSMFVVRSAYFTRALLDQLNGLKISCSVEALREKAGHLPGYHDDLPFTLTNGPSSTAISLPASHLRGVFSHVGYGNIPFDHSMGMLSIMLNIFYPTDNAFAGEELGYYRQREWRLIAGDFSLNERHLGRALSDLEKQRLEEIDETFWKRKISIHDPTGKITHGGTRSELARLYNPKDNWRVLDDVAAIYAPEDAFPAIRKIVGQKISLRSVADIGKLG